MPIEVKVPAVGESVSEVFIGQWYKAEGDRVAPDEGLVEIESEKATLDIPSPAGGVVSKILKQSGESAEVGAVIAHIEPEAAAPSTTTSAAESSTPHAGDGSSRRPPAAPPSASGPPPSTASSTTQEAATYAVPRSPREKWIIRQQPPGASSPTGPTSTPVDEAAGRSRGASTEGGAATGRPPTGEPIAARPPVAPAAGDEPEAAAATPAVRQTGAAAPHLPPAADREEETVPLSPIRRRIAARLVEAQRNAALLTTFNEIDMSAVKSLRAEFGEAFAKRHGVKLGFMSFFVKAAVEALRQCPEINAMIDGPSIVYRRYYDIGVAIGSQRGLVVPVLRNAERMTFAQVEKAIEDLAKRAQSGELRVDELQGGTFTISNGGVYGSLLSTPIVNPPQSGVLGMHAIQDRPIVVDGRVAIRPMMYVALSYDHRIVDGREAVAFLRRVKEVVEAPMRTLLEV
ncbi:MAG: dihydrolipoamide succinyltransferase [Planctomycetota bacterium]|nr:MAG: dihydrolipoamide succinyltransferase [Planctomycetota bacterium]